jgi:hypothetical protein
MLRCAANLSKIAGRYMRYQMATASTPLPNDPRQEQMQEIWA